MSNLPTKERILAEASRLFAQKSYDTVSVEEIAQAVGIKAPLCISIIRISKRYLMRLCKK